MGSEMLTASITIISGVVIFLMGQIISRFIIEPLSEQAKLIGEIGASLIYYKNASGGLEPHYIKKIEGIQNASDLSEIAKEIYTGRYEDMLNRDWERIDEAKTTFRNQASRLMSNTYAIPAYSFFSDMLSSRLPNKEAVTEASQLLIGLSNSENKDTDRGIEIARLLKIQIIVERFGG